MCGTKPFSLSPCVSYGQGFLREDLHQLRKEERNKSLSGLHIPGLDNKTAADFTFRFLARRMNKAEF